MNPFNLHQAVAELDRADIVRVANEARPPADYLFATFLPERPRFSYQAKTKGMTVRATMAGLSGMDSPYAEVGAIEITDFSEETAKLTSRLKLPEAAIRELQEMLLRLQVAGTPTTQTIQATALNFLDKLIVQSHLDAMEWLRGQALVTGTIDWTFNNKRLLVDYGIDPGQYLPSRTGNDAYGGSASKFWDDVRLLRKALRKYGTNGIVMVTHPDTADAIRYNSVNQLTVLAEAENSITFRRRGVNEDTQFLPGAEDTITLVVYNGEGELLDLANPGQTIRVPFMPAGKILAVARGNRRRFEVGDGSTPPNDIELGYTHLAPTVENGGNPGRWADLRVPDDEPWTVEGRGVTNGLPVVESVDRLAVATTEMA